MLHAGVARLSKFMFVCMYRCVCVSTLVSAYTHLTCNTAQHNIQRHTTTATITTNDSSVYLPPSSPLCAAGAHTTTAPTTTNIISYYMLFVLIAYFHCKRDSCAYFLLLQLIRILHISCSRKSTECIWHTNGICPRFNSLSLLSQLPLQTFLLHQPPSRWRFTCGANVAAASALLATAIKKRFTIYSHLIEIHFELPQFVFYCGSQPQLPVANLICAYINGVVK